MRLSHSNAGKRQAEASAPKQARAGRRPSAMRPWVLLGSGLLADERNTLKGFAAGCGADVAPKWRPGVTHIVCGLDKRGHAK